jgi:hypothetical protein
MNCPLCHSTLTENSFYQDIVVYECRKELGLDKPDTHLYQRIFLKSAWEACNGTDVPWIDERTYIPQMKQMAHPLYEMNYVP